MTDAETEGDAQDRPAGGTVATADEHAERIYSRITAIEVEAARRDARNDAYWQHQHATNEANAKAIEGLIAAHGAARAESIQVRTRVALLLSAVAVAAGIAASVITQAIGRAV